MQEFTTHFLQNESITAHPKKNNRFYFFTYIALFWKKSDIPQNVSIIGCEIHPDERQEFGIPWIWRNISIPILTIGQTLFCIGTSIENQVNLGLPYECHWSIYRLRFVEQDQLDPSNKNNQKWHFYCTFSQQHRQNFRHRNYLLRSILRPWAWSGLMKSAQCPY